MFPAALSGLQAFVFESASFESRSAFGNAQSFLQQKARIDLITESRQLVCSFGRIEID